MIHGRERKRKGGREMPLFRLADDDLRELWWRKRKEGEETRGKRREGERERREEETGDERERGIIQGRGQRERGERRKARGEQSRSP